MKALLRRRLAPPTRKSYISTSHLILKPHYPHQTFSHSGTASSPPLFSQQTNKPPCTSAFRLASEAPRLGRERLSTSACTNIQKTKYIYDGQGLNKMTPLVWIDCEMTGLDPREDVILQICCYITDHELNFLDEEGYETVIHYDQKVLNKMDEWCQATHTSTGLINRVLASTTTVEQATTDLLAYIKKHVPEKNTALLAGNSVHFDRVFLTRYCPPVVEHLRYRIMDVSTVKEAVNMWCSQEVRRNTPIKKSTHEARTDILESIEEMRYYKCCLFDRK